VTIDGGYDCTNEVHVNLASAWLALLEACEMNYRLLNAIAVRNSELEFTVNGFLELSAESVVAQYPFSHEAVRLATVARRRHARCVKSLAKLNRSEIAVITREMRLYPAVLHRTLGDQAPPVLCVAGNLSLLGVANAVAVVGARVAGTRSIATATILAGQLAQQGITVVSGNADGVDAAAHLGALRAGGTTVLVLPHGILTLRLRDVFRRLASPERLLAVSQFPPEAKWVREQALSRNKTVAALSGAVIVVEAERVSGTMSTALSAISLNKPVFVVCEPDGATPFSGNRALLDRGAQRLILESGRHADMELIGRALVEPEQLLVPKGGATRDELQSMLDL